MDTIVYLFMMVTYVILLSWGIRLAARYEVLTTANVLILVIVGLVFDNAVLGVGRFIGEGSLLETLNYLRYWLHAFLTPLLTLFAWNTLTRANVEWASKITIKYCAILYTTGLIVTELVTVVFPLDLEPSWQYGVLSYQSADSVNGPPVMILLLMAVLLFASIIIWQKQKWPWFFVGTVLIGAGSSVSFPIESTAATNIFELIFIFSFLMTKRFQDAKEAAENY